jgi:hypothetical protein
VRRSHADEVAEPFRQAGLQTAAAAERDGRPGSLTITDRSVGPTGSDPALAETTGRTGRGRGRRCWTGTKHGTIQLPSPLAGTVLVVMKDDGELVKIGDELAVVGPTREEGKDQAAHPEPDTRRHTSFAVDTSHVPWADVTEKVRDFCRHKGRGEIRISCPSGLLCSDSETSDSWITGNAEFRRRDAEAYDQRYYRAEPVPTSTYLDFKSGKVGRLGMDGSIHELRIFVVDMQAGRSIVDLELNPRSKARLAERRRPAR